MIFDGNIRGFFAEIFRLSFALLLSVRFVLVGELQEDVSSITVKVKA